MCPQKTETISLNVSRAEARWWRQFTVQLGVRSRGDLQKGLLMMGLQSMNQRAAKQLAVIRENYLGLPLQHARRAHGWIKGKMKLNA